MAAMTLVQTPPAPSREGTTFTVTAGTGATFDPVPFLAVVLPAGTAPTLYNAEVVLVTDKGLADDAWVVIRRQGGAARAIVTGDRVVQAASLPEAALALALPRAAPAFVNVTASLTSPRVHNVTFDLDT